VGDVANLLRRRKSFDSVSPDSQCPQRPIISSTESIEVMLLIDPKMLQSIHRGRITSTDSTAQRLQCLTVCPLDSALHPMTNRLQLLNAEMTELSTAKETKMAAAVTRII
jgi:hypothetical protein